MPRIPFPIGTCRDCQSKFKKLITKRCFEEPNFCYQKHKQRSQKERAPKEKKQVPIKPVSVKMADKLRRYRRLRDKHFKEKPVCEFPGCNSREISLHHAKGRIGSLLTNKRHFRSLCWPHHQFCEQNPLEAQRLGLSIKRLNDE